jgi:hypothetical protein
MKSAEKRFYPSPVHVLSATGHARLIRYAQPDRGWEPQFIKFTRQSQKSFSKNPLQSNRCGKWIAALICGFIDVHRLHK